MTLCPSCKAEVGRFHHKHDAPYGISDAHLDGSERFECPNCKHILSPHEARTCGLRYVLDTEHNEERGNDAAK